ncbi:MAG: ATP-binding protein, partial [Pseudomonadota bacterium]
ALSIAMGDIEASGATLNRDMPDGALPVMAGQVRLEQVVLNLITNALDAMADSDAKDLRIALHRTPKTAVLSVSDSGTGIADPNAVFEPFYSTKDLGASKGLGMGLALSHGIITRFGGTLTCRNLAHGAEFVVTLPLWEQEAAFA